MFLERLLGSAGSKTVTDVLTKSSKEITRDGMRWEVQIFRSSAALKREADKNAKEAFRLVQEAANANKLPKK